MKNEYDHKQRKQTKRMLSVAFVRDKKKYQIQRNISPHAVNL